MKNKIYLLFLTSVLTIISSCKLNNSNIWIDENIEKNIKSDISKLDQKILTAFINKDTSIIKELTPSEIYKKNESQISKLMEINLDFFDSSNYKIINQFHIKSMNTGTINHVMTGKSDISDYSIQYLSLNKETFISVIEPKQNLNSLLFVLIYGKYDKQWKLNSLKIGQYKLNNKNAPQLYEEAKKDFENLYLVDAANNIFLCEQVIEPAENIFSYNRKEEMKKLKNEISNKIKETYTFPITLDKIETRPKILNIYPKGMSEGFYPMIEYLTIINLKDTIKTKNENLLIQKNIREVFKGIDLNKKYIFYKALNEIPDGTKQIYSYGFVEEIK